MRKTVILLIALFCLATLLGAAPPGQQPDIPRLVDTLDFGVAAGNGYNPKRAAIDSQNRRLYTLNEGLFSLKQGNSLSVINLDTGRVIERLPLHNWQPGESFGPQPQALQFDPYRPRLYALWGDPYKTINLTIIDIDNLSIVDTLLDVDAVAPGPDRLYLANDNRLWSLDGETLAAQASYNLEARETNRPLLLNSEANRLYLGRAKPASIEIFAADSLAPVGSYPVAEELVQAVVDEANRRLLVVEATGQEQTILHALSLDGQALAQPEPVYLADTLRYSHLALVLSDQYLYLPDRDADSYATYMVRVYDRFSLEPVDHISLLRPPNDLVLDPETGLLYGVYSGHSHYALRINPANDATEAIYTALDVIDAVVDPASNRLYTLNEAGTLQILSLADYSQIDRIETGVNTQLSSNYHQTELSFDPGRRQLYISGEPVYTVDLDSGQSTAHPDVNGQITPDPTTDRLYLTPSCQCRQEQCNTWILEAGNLTGSETLFPPQDPLSAPCVIATQLDAQNQLLYARISNGVPGSNGGIYFMVFDVAASPQEIFTTSAISYGPPALDPQEGRAFVPRYRHSRGYLYRFGLQNGAFTQTLELVGAAGSVQYDTAQERLYVVNGGVLQTFDDSLTLLTELPLPTDSVEPITFDSQNQRLYLADKEGHLLAVAAGGGRLPPPPGPDASVAAAGEPISSLFIAPDGSRFRVEGAQLFRSTDEGRSWQLIGAGLPGHPIQDLAFSPTYERDGLLLAGLWNFGLKGGLYRSTDRGETWQPASRGLTDLEVRQVRFSPTFGRDRTIFVTTVGQGLFRSTDGGDSWRHLGQNYADESHDQPVDDLAVSPTFADDGLIIIHTGQLLRSTDGGETWTDTGIPGETLAFSPGGEVVLSGGRWRSEDGGQSWQPAAVGLEANQGIKRILFSPTNEAIYLLLDHGYDKPLTLQRSIDGGQSWQSRLSGGPPPDFILTGAVMLPDGKLYLRGKESDPLTVDPSGWRWDRRPVDIGQVDLQAMELAPDGTIFAANSAAGVFRSDDGGQSWVDTDFPARTNDIRPVQLALSGDGSVAAAVGPAIEISDDNGHSWRYLGPLPSPDFRATGLALRGDLMLAGGDYGTRQIFRSTDRGRSWRMVYDGSAMSGASDVALITFSPADPNIVYAWLMYGGLLRSTDSGQSWQLIQGEQAGYSAQSMLISPDGKRIYVGALNGHLLLITDEGQSWRDLQENIPGEPTWSSGLALTPQGDIFLGTDIGIYRSQDDGQSWQPVNTGLPIDEDTNVRVLRYRQGRLYAALTKGGVYISDNGGQSWRSSLSGAGPAPTPPPPATPTPPPSPTPMRQIPATPEDCPTGPAYFGEMWAQRVAQLGCPTGGQKLIIAAQPFERGWMFWREDTRQIYALPFNQPYSRFADTWAEDQPLYSCPDIGPAETPPTPQRGFGKVWCNNPQLRERLGQATDTERGFEATLQTFERGLIFQTDRGESYILEDESQQWE